MARDASVEKTLEDWRILITAECGPLGLMPAVLEFFDDNIAAGHMPKHAYSLAKQSCEIVEIIAET